MAARTLTVKDRLALAWVDGIAEQEDVFKGVHGELFAATFGALVVWRSASWSVTRISARKESVGEE